MNPDRLDAATRSTQAPILAADDLWKSYGSIRALRGLSFSLKPGRLLGFLGPNGAGKTTAIRILTTILEPDAGHFLVDGVSSSDDPERIRRRIGVLPESQGFPKHLTGLECLTYFGRLYGRTAADARAHGQALLEEVGLRQRARSLIGSYSRGMRQRLGIARALVNNPAVLFLDEPTLGLDPRGQHELLGLIRRITRERKAGVVLSSHHLAEVQEVCDEVIILNRGQVVAMGTVAEVITRNQHNVIRIHVPPPSVAQARHLLGALPHVKTVTPSDQTAGWLAVELAESADGNSVAEPRLRNRLLEPLIRADIPILSFEADGGRLQDVFLQLTTGTAE